MKRSPNISSELSLLRTRFMDELRDVRDFFEEQVADLLERAAILEEENEDLRDQLESLKDRYADLASEQRNNNGGVV